MNDPTLAAANLERGFYIQGSSVFFVNQAGQPFQLRSGEIPAMLRPARIPRCERTEDSGDPVLELLAETADRLPGAFAEPGIYVFGEEIVISMSQQLFSLIDFSLRLALPNDARPLAGGDLKAVERTHKDAISKIHRILCGGRLFRIV